VYKVTRETNFWAAILLFYCRNKKKEKETEKSIIGNGASQLLLCIAGE
jgi:hypothetical protein